MKISFDLDGTVWSYQAMFRDLMNVLLTSGHAVGILTGHDIEARDSDLRLLLSRDFPVPSFFICRDPNNSILGESSIAWKMRMIVEHDIQLHFEDAEDDKVRRIFEDSGAVLPIKPRLPLSEHFE